MAKNRAQQAAIAIDMKKKGKKPKKKLKRGGHSLLKKYKDAGYGQQEYGPNILEATGLNENQSVYMQAYGSQYQQQADMEKQQRESYLADIAAMNEAENKANLQQGTSKLLNKFRSAEGTNIKDKAKDVFKKGPDVGSFAEAINPTLPGGGKAFVGTVEKGTQSIFNPTTGQGMSLNPGEAIPEGFEALGKAAPGKAAQALTSAVSGSNTLSGIANVGNTISPYALPAYLVGEGIGYLADDKDETTYNVGEISGDILSGAGSGAGTGAMIGSLLGPIGAGLGAAIGGTFGLGKSLYKGIRDRNEAREQEEIVQEDARTKYTDFVSGKQDFMKNIGPSSSQYGTTYQGEMGGIKPMNNRGDMIVYGPTHEQGGVMRDPNTELEGGGMKNGVAMPGEVITKVMDNNGSMREYYFSDHLKNPSTGNTFAEDYRKSGGMNMNAKQMFAKLQEKIAGRNDKDRSPTNIAKKGGFNVKGVSTEGLTSRQASTLKEHSVHHSKDHIQEMVNAMKNGASFTASHTAAQKKVGKRDGGMVREMYGEGGVPTTLQNMPNLNIPMPDNRSQVTATPSYDETMIASMNDAPYSSLNVLEKLNYGFSPSMYESSLRTTFNQAPDFTNFRGIPGTIKKTYDVGKAIYDQVKDRFEDGGMGEDLQEISKQLTKASQMHAAQSKRTGQLAKKLMKKAEGGYKMYGNGDFKLPYKQDYFGSGASTPLYGNTGELIPRPNYYGMERDNIQAGSRMTDPFSGSKSAIGRALTLQYGNQFGTADNPMATFNPAYLGDLSNPYVYDQLQRNVNAAKKNLANTIESRKNAMIPGMGASPYDVARFEKQVKMGEKALADNFDRMITQGFGVVGDQDDVDKNLKFDEDGNPINPFKKDPVEETTTTTENKKPKVEERTPDPNFEFREIPLKTIDDVFPQGGPTMSKPISEEEFKKTDEIKTDDGDINPGILDRLGLNSRQARTLLGMGAYGANLLSGRKNLNELEDMKITADKITPQRLSKIRISNEAERKMIQEGTKAALSQTTDPIAKIALLSKQGEMLQKSENAKINQETKANLAVDKENVKNALVAEMTNVKNKYTADLENLQLQTSVKKGRIQLMDKFTNAISTSLNDATKYELAYKQMEQYATAMAGGRNSLNDKFFENLVELGMDKKTVEELQKESNEELNTEQNGEI